MIRSFLKHLAILMVTTIPTICKAQGQDERLFAYNSLLGAVTASIGALINKPAGTKWKHVLVNSLWQGAIGGSLRYTGKKTLYLISYKSEPGYALPAMLLQCAGNSIVENAAYNRPFLQSWNIDYGFFRFDFAFGKGVPRPKVRLLPAAVYGTCLAARQSTVNWPVSLASGCPVFETRKGLVSGSAKIAVIAGLSYGRAIIVNPLFTDNTLQSISHELVHYFQYTDYMICNTWLSKPAKSITPSWLQRITEMYIYCDIPYSSIPYAIEGYHQLSNYYDNFFELEAERFSTNKDIH